MDTCKVSHLWFKKKPFYFLRPFYSTGNQPRRVQWLFHVHALDIINTVKTSETTGGNGRQGWGDDSNKLRGKFQLTLSQNTTIRCLIYATTLKLFHFANSISLPFIIVARKPYRPSMTFLRTHSDTPHSVGLLWTSDQSDTEPSTWQYTTLTGDFRSLGEIRYLSPSKRTAVEPTNGCRTNESCRTNERL